MRQDVFDFILSPYFFAVMNKLFLLILLSLIFWSTAFAADLDLHVSHGRSYDAVVLSWQRSGFANFSVFRSDQKNGIYSDIALTSETVYEDTSCIPGVEYYYKVVPADTDASPSKSAAVSGYRKIKLSKLFDIDTEISKKDQSRPLETEIDQQRLKAIEPDYMGWLEIRFILFVSKPYISKGSVLILTDFDEFYSSEELHSITFYPAEQNYQLTFNSNQPFQILNRTNDSELFKRLIRNSLAFCIYQGEIKIKDRNGRNKYIPKLEAIGLATQYHKYYKNWPNSTILFTTGRDDLINKMKQTEE
jgi:hypothetical protein